MTRDDVIAAIMAGEGAALQVYSTVSQKPIANNPNAPIYVGAVPGGTVSLPQSSLLVVGLIIVAAIFVFKR